MFDNVVTLRKMTITVNEIGDPVEAPSTERDVFCRLMGCNETDKRIAESRGYSADYTVIFADAAEYEGELWMVLDGDLYRVADIHWTDTSNELRVVISRWHRQ